MKRFLCALVAVWACLGLDAQTRSVQSGHMSVTIPETWQSQIQDDGVMSFGIVALDPETETLYLFIEMDAVQTPGYIMTYSLKNNPAIGASADWDETESCELLSYEACQARFNNVMFGMTLVGKAIAFCDGSRSYGLVGMASPGHDFDSDPILASFRLVTGGDRQTSLSTREQLQNLIDSFQPYFGQEIDTGVTWNDLELHPVRDELTFTYGISLIRKSDLDEEDLRELKKAMAPAIKEAVFEMGRSMRLIERCREENYTFVIRVVDKDKKLLFSTAVTPEDYE